MRISGESEWDVRNYGAFSGNYFFMQEVDDLDCAHKRAKKELRKQQKAIEKKNNTIDFYRKAWEQTNEDNMRLIQEISQFKSEQSNSIEKGQERVIKLLNDDVVKLREQIIETEEKYYELLKQLVDRKDDEK